MVPEEYVEGYRAGYLSYHDTCPYEDGTDEHYQWHKGFEHGQEDWISSKPPVFPITLEMGCQDKGDSNV